MKILIFRFSDLAIRLKRSGGLGPRGWSLVAFLGGWLLIIVPFWILGSIEQFVLPPPEQNWSLILALPLGWVAITCFFVMPVGSFAFLPSEVVPRSLFLWRVDVSTWAGIFGGILAWALVLFCSSPTRFFTETGIFASSFLLACVPAGIVGGITCFTGAQTINRLKGPVIKESSDTEDARLTTSQHYDRNSLKKDSQRSGALMLYLDRFEVKARSQTTDKRFHLGSDVYACDEIYFGGWITLRGPSDEIVGFKIVTWASDDYLEKYVLPLDFVRLGQNVKLEKTDGNVYITILLGSQPPLHEDWNRIFEATFYRNRRNNFALRLDGFDNESAVLLTRH